MPLPFCAKRLHQRVIVVALADAEDREENAALALALDEAFQLVSDR